MEKINDRQIKNQKFKKQQFQVFNCFLLLLLGTILFSQTATAQIRAGAGYLKMMHGAREVSTFGTLTGALDHTYSFYANPAATGFSREWQWSATYTNWISDIYNASLLYGKNIRTPWSRWSRFVVGVNYLGIPEFNNAEQGALAVSGQNLLLTTSIGQPLHTLSRNISLGANVKFFNSQLAGYEVNKFMLDLGVLVRTPQIKLTGAKNSFFDTVILSSGVSISNMGTPIKYISEETPLPQTMRLGAAINIGSHHGFQVSLGSDYRKIRDEDGYFSCGTEFSWRQIFSFRMGYSWEDNLLGHFTFGGSLRFDDLLIRNSIAGRNNAVRLDLATNETNDYFTAPYHGSITHQPLEPEQFNLLSPEYNEKIDQDSVVLNWEETQDPDLYDAVYSYLLVDKDSSKLARIVDKVKQNKDPMPLVLADKQLLINRSTNLQSYMVTSLTGGDYFWTVLTFDKDEHTRLGKISNKPIARFHVTAPDPQVTDIQFDYSKWITRDDYQGILAFKVKNLGDRHARNFKLEIYDSLATHSGQRQLFYQQTLPLLKASADTTIYIEWNTGATGLHNIQTIIRGVKTNKDFVHYYNESFYTIPKGYFTTADTSIVQEQKHVIYDIPYVGKIYFDTSKAIIPDMFVDSWEITPPLALFAQRLKENPAIKIKIKGFTDPNSGESGLDLANKRAASVRDKLYELGVSLSQMQLESGQIHPRRRIPRKAEDARWVFEERRRVEITTEKAYESELFHPLQTTYIYRENRPVVFNTEITGCVALLNGSLSLKSGQYADSLEIAEIISHSNVSGSIAWNIEYANISNHNNWLQKDMNYSITLLDSLYRTFKTRPQDSYLNTKVTGRERRYYVLAKFEKTAPFYEFYWTSLLDIVPFLLQEKNTRMQFIGHGCATGPISINDRLSQRRANDFQNKFLKDVRKRYPDLYQEVKQRIDAPKGYGESRPFEIKSNDNRDILLGNDELPLGRQLNRRVMVLIYTK